MNESHEIGRLRDRVHEHGNHVQTIIANVDNLGEKMDAIHLSLKEDLATIKTETQRTNGRVTQTERELWLIRGIAIAATALQPFVVVAVARIIS